MAKQEINSTQPPISLKEIPLPSNEAEMLLDIADAHVPVGELTRYSLLLTRPLEDHGFYKGNQISDN